ncbi:NAD(P)-dependent oxidoreductase [Sphingobium subterraneum]|uniref:3-hydroxyisobutyrate dehydrogenase n=1 Tax=Sphingobium subterraneum TaxID=627688 RepID=A0A841IZU6_9SPHN|nr:NAD(P)-dependent oxidoreductase [Sphingobium subterraneum]MBB6122796.1 3-hydroxyisobutyrate dehydrogenase [Sphingobium subterraneum]
MANIAFIGLGVMGGAIAGHLAKAGHNLTVYNRSMGKAKAWGEAHGGEVAVNAAKAAEGADVVIACVGTDDDLASVTLGREGAFRTMTKGTLFIDHTTVSARIARQLFVEGESRGIHCVDAPVTGGQAGAENGTLAIMCGGTQPAVETARIVMKPYTSRIVHVGGAGAGQTTKMVNQITFAGIIQSLAEGMRFAQAAKLDLDKVFEAISGGAAQSWQMDNRWKTMAEDSFDFGFAVDWMRKDLSLAIEEARANGATLPTTAMIDQFYADVQAMGGGRQDTSAIIRRIPKR